MSGKGCSSTRKHTPIVSKKQRGFFGAELARKREGKSTKTDMSEAELVRHLKESKGKNLPKRSMRSKGSGIPTDNDMIQGYIQLEKGNGEGSWVENIPFIGPAIKGLLEQKKRLEKGSPNTGQTKQEKD